MYSFAILTEIHRRDGWEAGSEDNECLQSNIVPGPLTPLTGHWASPRTRCGAFIAEL